MNLETIIGVIIIVIVIAITVLLTNQQEIPNELLVALTGLISFLVGLSSKNPFHKKEDDNE